MTERFSVLYLIFAANRAEAEARAEGIAREQTVEVPRDVVPAGYIEDVILGQVAAVTEDGEGTFRAEITYSPDSVGTDLPQLINVIFGNSSIQKGLKVIDFKASPALRTLFPGARFGIDGIRRLSGRETGGFVCPVIKPQGSTAERLAEISYMAARAGADIIKEDHGLSNQPAAPFRERVSIMAREVARANAERAEAGDTACALYFANLCGPGLAIRDYAMHAKEAEAHGVLVMPGLFGFDAINQLAADDDFGLPIMAHPSHLGPYVLSPDTGYSHGVMFGALMRLAGADISVFPNVGGRFGFTEAECLDITDQCRAADGYGRPILPSPGGGMTMERMPDMMRMYGPDCVYLLGGGLLRYGDRIGEAIGDMRRALDTDMPGSAARA